MASRDISLVAIIDLAARTFVKRFGRITRQIDRNVGERSLLGGTGIGLEAVASLSGSTGVSYL